MPERVKEDNYKHILKNANRKNCTKRDTLLSTPVDSFRGDVKLTRAHVMYVLASVNKHIKRFSCNGHNKQITNTNKAKFQNDLFITVSYSKGK